MTHKSQQAMATAIGDIWRNYRNALGRYPTCGLGRICHGDGEGWECIWESLRLRNADKRQKTYCQDLLDEELAEIYAAYCYGDIKRAHHEIYEAIAVLLRMDDMIQDEQEKQQEK